MNLKYVYPGHCLVVDLLARFSVLSSSLGVLKLGFLSVDASSLGILMESYFLLKLELDLLEPLLFTLLQEALRCWCSLLEDAVVD